MHIIQGMENEIAKFVKKTRQVSGLNQEQFSAIIKTPRYNISKYETGVVIPPGNILWAILKIAEKQS